MNYIFGNNTLLYSRASRGGNTSSSHGSVGPKQKHWAKKGSSDELQAEPEPSRWQQIVAFFTRRHSFIDCISVATSSTQVTYHLLKWFSVYYMFPFALQKCLGMYFLFKRCSVALVAQKCMFSVHLCSTKEGTKKIFFLMLLCNAKQNSLRFCCMTSVKKKKKPLLHKLKCKLIMLISLFLDC